MRAAARSMAYLRKHGGTVAKVEHWNPHAKIRQDMFGFADLVWLSMDVDYTEGQICAVQVVNTHLKDHIAKINFNEAAQRWMKCGGAIEVHNWTKRGERGKRKTWHLEIIEIVPRITAILEGACE